MRWLTTLLAALLPALLPQTDVQAARQDTTLVSACSSNLSDPDAPVLEGLRATVGESVTTLLVDLLADSTAGELLLSAKGSTCLANMDGEALGEALLNGAAVSSCASALEILDIPFVQYALGNASAALSASGSDAEAETSDMLASLMLATSDEVEDFCALYVTDAVPCVRSQLLPSLATLRSTSSSGCCDAWEDESVSNFGYTLSGQFAKLAQLAGDVLCATQTPAFNGSSSQRCGFTFLQSAGELANTSSLERSMALLTDLEVPTTQACAKAEGEAYNDTAGNTVAALDADQFSASGCVVALDRFATWLADLPLAQNTSDSTDVDLTALFAKGDCVDGATLFPTLEGFFPASQQSTMSAAFAAACLNVPTEYADGCSFSRPASLVDWDYEPLRASQEGSTDDEGDSSTLNSLKTVPPNVTDSSSASSSATAVTGSLLLGTAILSLW